MKKRKFGVDIGGRKQAEAKILRLNHALRMISACNQTLVRAQDEKTLLDEVCQAIINVGDYRLTWVGFAEQDRSKSVRPVAQAGFDQGYLKTLNISWEDNERGRGPTGTAIRSGQTVIARDIHTDPNFAPWRQEALKRGYASSIALPLRSEGQTLGALNIYSPAPDAFDAEEVELLEELANDLAFGISALRIRTAHQQAEAALAASEFKLRSLFANMTDVVIVYDTDGRYVEIAPTNPANLYRPSEDVLGKTVHDILPKEQADYIVANINEAIQTGQVITGEYALQIGGEDRWFASSASRLTEKTVTWVARNITKRKLADVEILQRNQDLALINAINAAINRDESLTAITALISEEVRGIFNSLGVTLNLVNASSDRLVMQNAVLPDGMLAQVEKLIGGPLPLIEHDLRKANPFSRVLESKKAVLVTEPSQIKEYVYAYLKTPTVPAKIRAGLHKLGPLLVKLMGMRSQLIVPLLIKNEVIGTLDIGSRVILTEADLRRAETLAAQLTRVIERKRGEEQVKKQVEIQGALYDLSRALVEMEDFNPILDVLTRQVVKVTHVTFARVLLLEDGDLVTRAAFPVRVLDHDLQTGQREPLSAHPFCQHVFEENTSQVLQLESPEAGECEAFFLGIAKTLCVVPLTTHGHSLGLLMLGEARAAGREPFNEEKMYLARSIADQVAICLHRSLLHEETQRRLHNIEALHTIEQAISGSLDLHLTLSIILQQGCQPVECGCGGSATAQSAHPNAGIRRQSRLSRQGHRTIAPALGRGSRRARCVGTATGQRE